MKIKGPAHEELKDPRERKSEPRLAKETPLPLENLRPMTVKAVRNTNMTGIPDSQVYVNDEFAGQDHYDSGITETLSKNVQLDDDVVEIDVINDQAGDLAKPIRAARLRER